MKEKTSFSNASSPAVEQKSSSGVMSIVSHPIVTAGAAVFSTVTALSSNPLVSATITRPLVSAATREAVIYMMSSPGQTFIQSLMVKYTAEAVASNLIASGWAPYVLGAAAGGSVVTALAAINISYYSYLGIREVYRAFNGDVNQKQSIIFAEAEKKPQQEERFIARETLHKILESYESATYYRKPLQFFGLGSNQSGEIAALVHYLKANPGIQLVSISSLCEAISLCGKSHRIEALKSFKKIGDEKGTVTLSGTDKVLNEIIAHGHTINDDLVTQHLDVLGLGAYSFETVTIHDIEKAFEERSLTAHTDGKGNKDDFDRLTQAKESLLSMLNASVEESLQPLRP
jgi:hypothetical protein